jgi:hypothetical protein
MKTLDKQEMAERNKVQRVLTESHILSLVDHPFLPTVYCTLQTETHLHFVMEVGAGKGVGQGGREWRSAARGCTSRQVVCLHSVMHVRARAWRGAGGAPWLRT